jgi:hypothetical protein
MYGRFLQQCGDTAVTRGVPIIANILKNADNRYVKYYAKNALSNLLSTYQDRDGDLSSKISDMKTKNQTGQALTDLQNQLDSNNKIENELKTDLGQ